MIKSWCAVEPITADDDALRSALEEAHVPSLLAALSQLTGDLSLLREDLVPDTTFGAEQAGYTPEMLELGRKLCFDKLVEYRDSECPSAPETSDDALGQLMEFLTAAPARDEYLPLLVEELSPSDEDLRQPSWTKDDVAPDTPFRVVIVGAGMSGILAGIRLKQARVPFVILEKNTDVGGTWLRNTYPGCRVDNSNHFYSYSFAQRNDWPYFFSPQGVLLDYFRTCAKEFGILEHVRFETEVVSARWSEEETVWQVRLRSAQGEEETLEAQALVSAVGQLNRPKMPDIPGVERFEGPSFHSARWNHHLDLTGKSVAVIGTGSSAAQFVPIIAEQVAELRVFQRTPPWLLPVATYHAQVPEGLSWLFHHVPRYAQWYRFWLYWTTSEGLLPAAAVDPDWQPKEGPEHSVSAANDELRAVLTEFFHEILPAGSDLLAKVVPKYPPASKRIVFDSGVWLNTLKQEHVHLIVDPIQEITEKGVRTSGDEYGAALHEADVLIYATGFHASRFLTPMKIKGRGGVDLHEQWDGKARAYLGVTIPNFPNFFCLYGPNTNIVVNGSIVWFSECEVHYLLECVRLLLEEKRNAMSCKPEVHDAYNVRIDEGNRQMAWGVSKVNSWYKSENGHIAQNWPFSLLEFWEQTRTPDPADYEFL